MLLDNPIVLRELWQRLTGGRLALGVLLAVGLQALALAVGFASWSEGSVPRSASLELGHWLHYLWVWALLIYVSCSTPVRTYGLFDWESRRSCLDQHVITGSSPLRTLGGKLSVLALHGGVVLLASLPLGLVPVLLGTVPVGWVLESLLVTVAFAFMLSGLVIWGSMIEPEVGVTFAVLAVGWLTLLLAIPVAVEMPELGCLFPVHHAGLRLPGFFLQVSREPLPPTLFGVVLPAWRFEAGMYLAVGLLGWLMGVAGPRPVRGPQGRTFGAVLQERGRRRRGLGGWLVSRLSRRRADLRFLYQNRPRWLCRLEEPLRQGQQVLLGALVVTVAFGLVWSYWLRGGVDVESTALYLLIAALVSGAVALQASHAGRGVTLGCLVALLVPPVVHALAAGPLEALVPGGLRPPLTSYLSLILLWGVFLVLVGHLTRFGERGRLRGIVYQLLVAAFLWGGAPLLFMVGASMGAWGGERIWMAELSPVVVTAVDLDNGGVLRYPVPELPRGWGGGEVSVSRATQLALALIVGAVVLLLLRHLLGWAWRQRRGTMGLAGALGLLLLLPGLGAQPVQEPPRPDSAPSVQLWAGIGGQVISEDSVPVTILVQARETPVEGELRLGHILWSGTEVLWRVPLSLGAGEGRRYRRLVSLQLGFTRRSSANSLVASVVTPGHDAPLVETSASLTPGWPGLVLVTRPGREVRGWPAETCQRLEPVALPEEAVAWLCTRAVILAGVRPGELEPRQSEALAHMVLEGGRLALATGQRREVLDASLRGGLCPDLPHPGELGTRKIPLLAALTPWAEEVGPVPLADLTPLVEAGQEVLLESGGLVLATGQSAGRGWLVTLAFDPSAPPLEGTRAGGLLLGAALDDELPRPLLDGLRSRARDLRRSQGGTQLIGGTIAVTILLAILVPYLASLLLRRSALTWLLIPVGSLVALLIVAGLVRGVGGARTLVIADRVSVWGHGEGPACSLLHLWLCSRGQEDLPLELAGRYPQLTLRKGAVESMFWREDLTIRPGIAPGVTRLGEVRVGRFQSRLLTGSELLEERPPARVALRENRLAIEALQEELEEVWLVGPTGWLRIGRLSPDPGEQELPLPGRITAGGPSFYRVDGDPSRMRDVTAQALYRNIVRDMVGGRRERILPSRWLLLGRRRQAERVVVEAPGAELGEGVDLVVLPVEVEPGAAFTGPTLSVAYMGRLSEGEGQTSGDREEQEFELWLVRVGAGPRPPGGGLSVTGTSTSLSRQVGMWVLGPAGEWMPLEVQSVRDPQRLPWGRQMGILIPEGMLDELLGAGPGQLIIRLSEDPSRRRLRDPPAVQWRTP